MSSLREAVTPKDWASSMILLFKSAFYYNKVLLVLEGESDILFFNTNAYNDRIHFDSPCCGKPEVIQAVNDIRRIGYDKCYGICDADFDHISGVQYENIYFTDFHDLEMMLIAGGVVDRFIDSFTKHTYLIGHDRDEFKEDLKAKILDICYSIGILKWLNYKHNILLRFKSMRYMSFIVVDNENITFSLDDYINHIIARSGRISEDYNFDRIKREYLELMAQGADKLHICNGHDFMHIISMVFQCGLSTVRNMSKENVESHMRIGYHSEMFKTTNLYGCIEQALGDHS